jgi:hypothetical protein
MIVQPKRVKLTCAITRVNVRKLRRQSERC